MGMRMPEQQAPAPQAAAPQQEAAGQLEQLVTGVGEGLATLAQVVSQANPELGQQMQAIMQQYDQVISALGGGGQPAPGQAPVEAGAAATAPAM